jgi:hypothetical protein
MAVAARHRRRAHVVHVADLGGVVDQPDVDAPKVQSENVCDMVDRVHRKRRVAAVVKHVLVGAPAGARVQLVRAVWLRAWVVVARGSRLAGAAARRV